MLNGGTSSEFSYRESQAELPADFGERLKRLKERTGLTWEGLAEELGVDCRQLFRWRTGTAPSGGAMLSIVRLAAEFPDGLDELLGDELLGEEPADGWEAEAGR